MPVVVIACAALVVHRRTRNWGARDEELDAALPGDELVPNPTTTVTRGVTIEAPAEVVWQWLVQIGQDRGGMYSYDWLENLVGLDIQSTDHIDPRWQRLQVGDRVRLVPAGWLGMRGGYSLPVIRLDPGRAIVLRQCPPEHPWDATWSFVVVSGGPNRCRLLARSRSAAAPGWRGGAGRIGDAFMGPVTLFMERGMLLGIKRRAEGPAPQRPAPSPSLPSR